MALCPHCGTNSIGFHSKWWSSAAHPAKCKQCGGRSYIARTSFAYGSAIVGGLIFSILPAILLTRSLWVGALIIAAILAVVAYDGLAFYRAPMLPTNSASSAEARRWEHVGLIIMAAVVCVVVAAFMVQRAA